MKNIYLIFARKSKAYASDYISRLNCLFSVITIELIFEFIFWACFLRLQDDTESRCFYRRRTTEVKSEPRDFTLCFMRIEDISLGDGKGSRTRSEIKANRESRPRRMLKEKSDESAQTNAFHMIRLFSRRFMWKWKDSYHVESVWLSEWWKLLFTMVKPWNYQIWRKPKQI